MKKNNSPFHFYQKMGQKDLPDLQLNEKLNDDSLYIPSKPLVDAVNVALSLGQPLLLTGEPGTGKTQLAYHLSHFFKLDKPLVFNAQTSSGASDLFYKYDALGHFQYNQNHAKELMSNELEQRFIQYQALGKAILYAQDPKGEGVDLNHLFPKKELVNFPKRSVVLIDEIDKAPRDLPNDVLAAIEHLEFNVPEINKTYRTIPKKRPIIILTSNSEKNLPDAFLRRVVYYHIPFPAPDDLLAIISAKVEGYPNGELEILVDHFNKIRDKSIKLKKKPATAELIYWTMLLKKIDFKIKILENLKLRDLKNLNEADKKNLLLTYSVLAKNKEDLAILNDLCYPKRQ